MSRRLSRKVSWAKAMAREGPAPDSVRPRGSPPYRATIRVNVLHGRKSISWAKSVLPLFTGASSETFRKVPDRVQTDTRQIAKTAFKNMPLKAGASDLTGRQ